MRRYPKARARRLRQRPTEAEQKFWRHVRRHQVDGWGIRRQHPVAGYVVDFYCPAARLVIEIDGGQHGADPRDARRTALLEAQGCRVVRYWNNEVLQNIEGVLADLRQRLAEMDGTTG